MAAGRDLQPRPESPGLSLPGGRQVRTDLVPHAPQAPEQAGSLPCKTVIDKGAANAKGIRGIRRMLQRPGRPAPVEMVRIKCLNNLVEQDHRFVKRRARPMPGFKSLTHASRFDHGRHRDREHDPQGPAQARAAVVPAVPPTEAGEVSGALCHPGRPAAEPGGFLGSLVQTGSLVTSPRRGEPRGTWSMLATTRRGQPELQGGWSSGEYTAMVVREFAIPAALCVIDAKTG